MADNIQQKYEEYNSIAQQAINALRSETDEETKAQYQSIVQQAMDSMRSLKAHSDELGGIYNTETGEWDQIGQPKKERLPVPHTQMYSGLNDQQSRELFNSYKKSEDSWVPNSIDSFLGADVIYRGADEKRTPYIVPPPTSDVGDDIFNAILGTDYPEWNYVSLGSKISGGVKNMARNLAEGVAAGIDTAADYVTGEEGTLGLTEKAQSKFPKMATGDSLVDSVVMEGVPVVGGILTGTALVQGLSKVPTIAAAAQYVGPFVSRMTKGVSTFLAADVGMTASVGSDSGTLLVGDKAMLPILDGFNLPEDPTEAEKVLTKRANILADSLILSGPLAVAGNSATHIAGFLKTSMYDPILGIFSGTKREQALVQSILDRLSSVTDATTPAEIKEIQKQIVSMIDDNKELVVEMGNRNLDDVALTFDTMGALQQALQEGNTSAIDSVYNRLRMQSDKLRKSQIDSGGVETQIATEQPAKVFDDTLSALEDGGTKIDPAKDELIGMGQRVVDEADSQVQAARAGVQEAEENLVKVIAEDPTVGAKVTEIEKLTGINIYSGKNQAIDSIIDGTRQAYEVMKSEKDRLYAAVKGGNLTPEPVLKMFSMMDDEQTKALLSALPNNSPVRGLISESRWRYETVELPNGKTKRVRESDIERDARVSAYLVNNNIDFGYIYREVRPTLAETGSLLYAAGDPVARRAGKSTKDWVKYIDTDLLDWVAKNSDQTTAQNATAAKKYYMEEFQPYWNDGALGQVADLYDSTVGRTSTGMAKSGLEIQPVNFEQGSLNILSGALTEGNRKQADQLVNLLGSPNSSVSPSLVTDYVIADILADISTTVRSQGTGALDLAQINASLSKYGSVLENFPEESKRILSLMDNLKKAGNNVDAQKIVLDQAQEVAEEAKVSIYSDVLRGFFKNIGARKVANPNGFAVFQKILNDPQAGDQIEALVLLAKESDNPLILEGMQEAFARSLKSRLLGSTREVAGSRALNLGNTTKMLDDQTNQLINHGEVLFADMPEVIEGIKSIIAVNKGIAIGKRARPVAGSSNTAFSLQAQRTTDNIVKAMIGPLTRTGARIHAGVSTTIARLAPDEAAALALDKIMANPEEFVRIARELQAEPVIDARTAKTMFDYLVRIGIYNESDEIDYINALAQMEILANEAIDDTQDAFSLR